MNLLKMISIMLMVALSSACSTVSTFSGSLNSYAKGEVIKDYGETYFIKFMGKSENYNSFERDVIEGYLDKALQEQGFVKVDEDSGLVDLVIFADYEVSELKNFNYTAYKVNYGQVGVSSSSTTGTVDAYGNYSANTTYTPQYGITGSTPYTATQYYRTRFLSLNGYTVGEGAEEVFSFRVVSNGSSADPRVAFPAIIAGSKHFIAKNSGKMVDFTIREGDRRIKYIKGELTKEEVNRHQKEQSLFKKRLNDRNKSVFDSESDNEDSDDDY